MGTVVGLIIAGVTLHFKIPEGYTLTLMLITLVSYLILRKNYGWATVGFTDHRSVYPATVVAERRAVHPFASIDTMIGCLIAFGGMVWLWPQWQRRVIA